MSEVDISAFRNSSASQRSTYSQPSQQSSSFAPRSYTSRQSSASAPGGSSSMPARDNTLPGTQPRYSQGGGGSSGRPSGSRRQVNLSSIEKSVTHLLVATKQLLETLTAWSRGNASEAEVSDVYVRLGSEFNNACRSFMAIGVETADLGNVPDELRTILESTLSQDASQESLEVYLPRIREIIINLLHGLRRKQSKLRSRQQREQESGSGSRSSGERTPSGRPVPRAVMPDAPEIPDDNTPPRSSSLPQRNTPPTSDMQPPARSSTPSSSEGRLPRQRQGSGQAASPGSLQEPIPPLPRGSSPAPPPPPAPVPEDDPAARFIASSPPPPAPPPPAQEALAALQRENALERRASRRYSLYQSQTIAKLTGSSASDVQMIPSGGRTARKRESKDAKDSMDAIRMRQSLRAKPKTEQAPARTVNRISEEKPLPAVESEKAAEAKTAVEAKSQTQSPDAPTLKVDAGASPPHTPQSSDGTPGSPVADGKTKSESRSTTPASQKEMVIFLQIGRAIKKAVISDDIEDLSLSSLRLLFISKFAYNPPSGENFPEIYLQDPTSGVRYELEDMADVKDRSILCLNVEVLDEVKRHIDDGIQDLKKLVEGVKGQVESQGAALQKVSEAQKDAAAKLASLSVSSPSSSATPTSDRFRIQKNLSFSAGSEAQIKEIQTLRKELGSMREKYSSFVDTATSSLKQIKIAASHTPQGTAGPVSSGRNYVESGKKLLSADTDTLVTRVDDLQDIVEDLRKDVVQRGVRPLPRKLEEVSKEIARARSELKKMADYIRREKPLWKKVWERELETVCEDQQFCNMQEELVADLEDDLDKAATTFNLVEQCSQQQLKSPFGNAVQSGKFLQRDLEVADPTVVKGNVLSEVRGLKPNHQSRVEAIERAEKARQKELQDRVPPFQKELGQFVAEAKLKSTGGIEEVERQRVLREEEARKEAARVQLEIAMRKQEAAQARAAAAAAAAAEANSGEGTG